MDAIHESMTYDEFLSYQDEHPRPDKIWLERSSTLQPPTVWNGNTTWDEAIRLAHEGWPEGLARLTALTIEDRPTSGLRRPRMEYAPAGMRPSIPHYLAGDPAYMQTWTPRPSAQRPILTILNCASARCDIEADTYERRGAALVSLIDAIENEGVSTRLINRYACASETDQTTPITIEIEIKAEGQPLDADRIMFAIAHAAFLRRLVFRWKEQNRFFHHFSHVYGYPQDVPDPLPTHDMLVIPRITRNDSRPVSKIAADLMTQYHAHIFKGETP